MKMNTLKAKTVGHETVHPNQQLLALTCLNMLLDNEKPETTNKRSPILIGQPQSGKTGAIIEFLVLFIADCVARGRTFQIVVGSGLPQIELAEQTKGRLKDSLGLDGMTRQGAQLDSLVQKSNLNGLPKSLYSDQLVIRHNSVSLKDLDLNATPRPVDVRLFLIDEVHIGNVLWGNIDIMCRNHGAFINEQIHAWDNSKTINHFMGVSATPSAHMIMCDNMPLKGSALFTWAYEAPPSNYLSLGMLLNSGRLIQTEPLFLKSGPPTTFLKRVLRAFRDACKAHGPGHLVIRAVGKQNDRLMEYINQNGKIEVKVFDSAQGNIDELNAYLSTQPSEPMVVVIRSSMRAGITLGQKNFIRGWVETKSVNSDSQAQSGAGRACGYGREVETYPIYCDIRHIESWVKAYEEMDQGKAPSTVPKGQHNIASHSMMEFHWDDVLDFKTAYELHVEPFKDNDKRDAKGNKIGGKGVIRRQIAKCSENASLDVADLIMNYSRRSASTSGCFMDAPTTLVAVRNYLKGSGKKYTEADVWGLYNQRLKSWETFEACHPDKVGKVIMLKPIKIADSRSRSELQKGRSALKKA